MTENLRLKPIRKQRLSVPGIASAYTQWVSEDDILIFKKDNDVWGHKASKRGNDVYTDHINFRFRDMKRKAKNDNGISLYGAVQETKSDFLFITLTTKQDESIDEAWENIGKKFNQFRSNLIRKYGKIEFMRTWESHKKGYPHVHCLVKFLNYNFDVYKGIKNQKPHWLVKDYLNIKSLWNFGFADVSACTSVREGLSYVGKYIIKNAVKDNPNENLTLALSWYYGKRAFSVSGNFFIVLLSGLCNSNKITNPSIIFLGCFSRSFVYGFVLNKKPFEDGVWDNKLSLEILDHLPLWDKKINDGLVKQIPKIILDRRCYQILSDGNKMECFDSIIFDNDYGSNIEYAEIETNNSRYTDKEKDIIADMELDEIGFSSGPHSMRARKKIREIMIRMGHAQGKVLLFEALKGQFVLLSNGILADSYPLTSILCHCDYGFTLPEIL